MSTIKANNLTNISGDTTVSMSGGSLITNDVRVSSINSGPITGFRNRIINGGMDIDQRNAGAAVSLNNNGGYAVDRFFSTANNNSSGTGTATIQRVVDAPPGFRNSLKYTITNPKSPGANDEFYIYQAIEGQNVMDFAFGTSSAKTITLSFWVKSSLTGTFSGFLRSENGGSSYRSYNFNYTINSANTWQYVTITAPGDTGQSFLIDNTRGFAILFDLGSGSTYQTSTLNSWQTGNFYRSTTSVNLISTLNATFQVTGVQLEVGTTATPFERRAFGQELLLCQRYFETSYDIGVSVGASNNQNNIPVFVNINVADFYNYGGVSFQVTKRTTPSIIIYSPRDGSQGVLFNISSGANVGNSGVDRIGVRGFRLYCSNSAMSPSNSAYGIHYTANAEL